MMYLGNYRFPIWVVAYNVGCCIYRKLWIDSVDTRNKCATDKVLSISLTLFLIKKNYASRNLINSELGTLGTAISYTIWIVLLYILACSSAQ